ncbi:MAG TPA: DUF402 domain-containing protein [Gaiellaceae bacterium]|nr:DUF402 domain-containing protein [Gaiellaceae bacterium]
MLIRHLACGRVVTALPSIVVDRTAERVVTWIGPGTPIAYPLGRENGRLRPFAEWEVELREWVGPGRLEVTTFGRRHSIRLIRDDAGVLLGWYVNLQAPLVESRFGFDTTDWQLDLWIEPEGAVHWKDEDDLRAAVELGILSPEDARAAREEAERVIAEWPFPTGFEAWQPEPAWPVPTLPADWAEAA